MTTYRNGFESGTVGQAVDATTSAGANDDALTPTIGAGSSIVFDDVWAAHGIQSAKITTVASQVTHLAKTLPAGTGSVTVAGRINGADFASPPLSAALAQIRNAGSQVATFGTSGSGKMVLQDSSGTIWTSGVTMPLSDFGFELAAAKGTTVSNGTLKLSIFLGGSTSPIESGPTTPSARNAGTADLTEVRVAKVASAAWANVFHIDALMIVTGTTGPLGAWTSPPKPGKPTGVTAAAGSGVGEIDVAWTAPADPGATPITGYTVTPYIGTAAQTPQTFTSTATGQTLTGLTPGTSYTCTVKATNTAGSGDPSLPSAAAIPPATPTTPAGGVFLLSGGTWKSATVSALAGGSWL